MSEKSGVKRAIEAEGGKQQLADRWGVTYQAIDKFDRQGWFPLERARQAADQFAIPLRDLVRSDIREALDARQG